MNNPMNDTLTGSLSGTSLPTGTLLLRLGRRTLLELVGQYDSYARLERDQVSLDYSIALLELEIARDRGLLVDGARM